MKEVMKTLQCWLRASRNYFTNEDSEDSRGVNQEDKMKRSSRKYATNVRNQDTIKMNVHFYKRISRRKEKLHMLSGVLQKMKMIKKNQLTQHLWELKTNPMKR